MRKVLFKIVRYRRSKIQCRNQSEPCTRRNYSLYQCCFAKTGLGACSSHQALWFSNTELASTFRFQPRLEKGEFSQNTADKVTFTKVKLCHVSVKCLFDIDIYLLAKDYGQEMMKLLCMHVCMGVAMCPFIMFLHKSLCLRHL